MDETIRHLGRLKLSRDLVIVYPTYGNWYDLLGATNELRDRGFSIVLLDRFVSDVSFVTEKKMNELGWYRND